MTIKSSTIVALEAICDGCGKVETATFIKGVTEEGTLPVTSFQRVAVLFDQDMLAGHAYDGLDFCCSGCASNWIIRNWPRY